MKLGNNLLGNGYELQNVVLHRVNGDPANRKEGLFWWDTAAKKAKWALDATTIVDPLNRATHTGNVPVANVSGLTAAITAITLDQMTAPAGDLSMNSKRLRSLPAPVNADEPVRLVDLQNVQAGSDFKNSVRVMADTNIALTGTPVIQGVQTAVGDRIAALGQTDASKQLVYKIPVGGGAWTIEPDFSQGALSPGAVFAVEEGTYQGRSYRLNNTGAITVGTTALNWQLYAAGVTYVSMSSEIGVSGNQLTYKGTKSYSTVIGDGVATSFNLSHGLDCGVKVSSIVVIDLANSNQRIFPDEFVNANNTVNIVFGTAPALNSIQVNILGQA